MISNRWKILAAALPIMLAVFGTLALAQPQPGGLGGFFQAWWGSQREPWTPASLTLSFWLDASTDDDLTFTSGRVTYWVDKSGNGYAATAATSYAPSWTNNHFNGLGALHFSEGGSASNRMVITSFTGTTNAMTTLGVWQSVTWPSNPSYPITGNASGNSRWAPAVDNNAAFGWQIGDGVNFTTITADRNLGLFGMKLDGTTGEALYNGTNIVSGFSETIASAPTTWQIGAISSANRFIGYIAEIVHVNYALSTDEQQKLEGYLAHKWGIESKLPADHPYKDAPP